MFICKDSLLKLLEVNKVCMQIIVAVWFINEEVVRVQFNYVVMETYRLDLLDCLRLSLLLTEHGDT